MRDFAASVLGFLQAHEAWTAPVVFVLAFCESFAFVSLFVPATVILFGLGGVMGLTGLAFWPVWAAAALGAAAGDWLAYALAFRFKSSVFKVWPLSRDPALVERGTALFGRWGIWAVFIGRFFGPLRAVVPLLAGVFAMPWMKFQIANVASAALWAAGILAPGVWGIGWLKGLFG